MPSAALASCRYITPSTPEWFGFGVGGAGPYGGRLSAELCVNSPNRPSVVWTNFSPVSGGVDVDTKWTSGSFWDPARYGGSTTIWANETITGTTSADVLGSGGTVSQQAFLYYRIWITPSGAVYTYDGF